VDPVGTAWPGVPVVGASNFAGGVTATEHLLSLGHKRIGIIPGDPNVDCAQERLAGYRSAMSKAKIPIREEYIKFGDFQTTGGYAGADAMFKLPEPPTAIFAGSDQQAYGVYAAAKAHGLSVPADISVVGFDDVSLCQWVSPKLTTIRQPLEEMAREAVRLLCAMAYQGAKSPKPKIELGTSLVTRESTCPPRG
jgi:LacI family transcriptional regulator